MGLYDFPFKGVAMVLDGSHRNSKCAEFFTIALSCYTDAQSGHNGAMALPKILHTQFLNEYKAEMTLQAP